MTKNDFLQQLEVALKRLPSDERADIVQDYRDHFTFGVEEGKSEAEIAASLGSPKQIAKELLANYHIEQVNSNVTAGNIVRAVWAGIGLGFFNIAVVLGPAITVLGLMFTGWVIGASFVLSPLLVLIDAVVHPGTFFFFPLFVSIGLCGLGYFILLGMFWLTKVVIDGFVRYLQYNVSLVKGGLKHE